MEATFCFVDLAGFTALTEAHGAEAAADCVQQFVRAVEEALAGEGRLIERIGDAVFVTTPTPGVAVRFLVRLFAITARQPDFLVLRAGLHHGEALERDGSFFGATINLAARVAAQAGGGQVLATAPVAEAARADGVAVTSLGAFALRNVRDRVELFALGIADATAADTTAIDPVCRMRVTPQRAAGRLRFGDKEYWFCSLDCAAAFARAPESYVPE